jgi:hypothetical protein
MPGVGGYPQGLIIGLTNNALQSPTEQNIRTWLILSAQRDGGNERFRAEIDFREIKNRLKNQAILILF